MRAYAELVDTSVICALCAGRHLAKLCPLAAELIALVPAEVPDYRPHGTLAAAIRERRAGGHASMCPACKEAWTADQRKHRAARRARAQQAA